MSKVILTVGVAGSGKTTWAREYVKNNGNTQIISRDDIRHMLAALDMEESYVFSKEAEKRVREFQIASIDRALSAGSDVIVCDTNLKPARREEIKMIADSHDAEYVERPFIVPWVELVKRNNQRGRNGAIPMDQLRNQYKSFRQYLGLPTYTPNKSLPDAVIFDIDGTLADNSHRSPYNLDTLSQDKLRPNVAKVLRLLKLSGVTIITVSGRHKGKVITDENGAKHHDDTRYQDATLQWLADNILPVDHHFQRETNDFRSDDIIKEEIFFRDIAPNFNVLFCLDDRTRVVDMWRFIGVECWQVNNGDF